MAESERAKGKPIISIFFKADRFKRFTKNCWKELGKDKSMIKEKQRIILIITPITLTTAGVLVS
ncbi:unnamed protein product [marine sediment metagenome]|uniref:Uncharacterized protein n=1 Tax=marine sediment metagenome TaxID=412755 RepID=X1HFY6_9ZZZZ